MLDCLECNFVKRPFHRVLLLQAQESKSNGRPHITFHYRAGRFQPVGDLVSGERSTRGRGDGRDSIKDPALDLVDLQCDTSFPPVNRRKCRRQWRRSQDGWCLREALLETGWRLGNAFRALVHGGECYTKCGRLQNLVDLLRCLSLIHIFGSSKRLQRHRFTM